ETGEETTTGDTTKPETGTESGSETTTESNTATKTENGTQTGDAAATGGDTADGTSSGEASSSNNAESTGSGSDTSGSGSTADSGSEKASTALVTLVMGVSDISPEFMSENAETAPEQSADVDEDSETVKNTVDETVVTLTENEPADTIPTVLANEASAKNSITGVAIKSEICDFDENGRIDNADKLLLAINLHMKAIVRDNMSGTKSVRISAYKN
ncbi:MAG: hypothetical protein ACI4A5_11735, partial [Hominilimicola sp.]